MFIDVVREITKKNKKVNKSTAEKHAETCYESKIKPLIIEAAEKGLSHINICLYDILDDSLFITSVPIHLVNLIRREGFVCYESEERNQNSVYTIVWRELNDADTSK